MLPTSQRRRIVMSDGVVLSVIDTGNSKPDAPLTLALIPGWCMPAWLWQPQIDALDAHYPVIALDPRGQGESDVPERGYTLERRARDIHEFLQPCQNVLLVARRAGSSGIRTSLRRR